MNVIKNPNIENMKTILKSLVTITLVSIALITLSPGCAPEPECQSQPWYADSDGDGYGDPETLEVSCDQPQNYVADNTDCNDNNPNIHPGAVEITGNDIDDDCDGIVDECETDADCDIPGEVMACIDGFCQVMTTYYADNDGDGYGDPNNSIVSGETPPNGYVTNNTDCDDTNATVYLGAPELCDGIDNNCDGIIDNNTTDCQAGTMCLDGVCVAAYTYYQDLDNDGFGNPDVTSLGSDSNPPSGWLRWAGDCDDTNAGINILAQEIMGNGIDDNCNGLIDGDDVRYIDTDGDGYGSQDEAAADGVFNNLDCDDTDPNIHPFQIDIPLNGIDEDCDGEDASY